jgi:carbon monoxide dehydrogenase subunit G
VASVDVSIDIAAPCEAVWEDLADLRTHGEWMSDVVGIDVVGEPHFGVGTVLRVFTKVGPLRTVDVIRVTRWVPPRLMEVGHEGMVTGTGTFRLEAIDGGTRFRWSEHLRLPWYLGGPLGARIAAPILARIWRSNLRRLAARFVP